MAHGQKTGGRIAGTPNKVTSDVKSRIAALIDNQFDSIQADLELLEPKDRITVYLKFLEYVLPKQREQTNIDVDFSLLSIPFQVINPDNPDEIIDLNCDA